MVVARGAGVGGEVVLRRRSTASGDVDELIVNGTFLMDTAETSTERLLADALLEAHDAPRQVVVGGLGLGFTVDALLADPRVEHVEIVEIEPLLVQWLRAGLATNSAAHVLDDPRVHVTVADVRTFLATATAASVDAILLDVDNGPDFLVHEGNAAVYASTALHTAARTLRRGGMLGLWSAAASPDLAERLRVVVGPVDDVVRTVPREGRQVDYHVYLARRPTLDRSSPADAP